MRVELAQQADEQRHLFFHRGEVDELAHLVGGDPVRLDAHQLRIVHVLVGELEHALRQRGREQHRLALLGLGQPAQDEADVGDEAEVEHAVGFVEHHGLGMAHVEHVLLEVVDDAAGRADQHVDAVLQRLALFFVVDAAIDDGDPEARVLTQHLGVVEDLHGELARGREDQRANAATRCGPGAGGFVSRRWYSATRNAAVLPVPVWAWPATSLPVSAIGKVLAWTGVARTKPASRDAAGDFRNEIERRERELGKVCLCH